MNSPLGRQELATRVVCLHVRSAKSGVGRAACRGVAAAATARTRRRRRRGGSSSTTGRPEDHFAQGDTTSRKATPLVAFPGESNHHRGFHQHPFRFSRQAVAGMSTINQTTNLARPGRHKLRSELTGLGVDLPGRAPLLRGSMRGCGSRVAWSLTGVEEDCRPDSAGRTERVS